MSEHKRKGRLDDVKTMTLHALDLAERHRAVLIDRIFGCVDDELSVPFL
jgi:hypothetical protein